MIPFSPLVGGLVGGVGNSVYEIHSSKQNGHSSEKQVVAAQYGFVTGVMGGVVGGFCVWVTLPIAPLWIATSILTEAVPIQNYDYKYDAYDDYDDL